MARFSSTIILVPGVVVWVILVPGHVVWVIHLVCVDFVPWADAFAGSSFKIAHKIAILVSFGAVVVVVVVVAVLVVRRLVSRCKGCEGCASTLALAVVVFGFALDIGLRPSISIRLVRVNGVSRIAI
jgi:hypothetical protein